MKIQAHIFGDAMPWQDIGTEPFDIRGNEYVPSPVASMIADEVAETDKPRGLVQFGGQIWSFRIIQDAV